MSDGALGPIKTEGGGSIPRERLKGYRILGMEKAYLPIWVWVVTVLVFIPAVVILLFIKHDVYTVEVKSVDGNKRIIKLRQEALDQMAYTSDKEFTEI